MKLWCHVCDAKVIDSEKPESGKFYQVTGHIVDFRKKEVTDEYTTVAFAVCPSCKCKNVIHEADYISKMKFSDI